MKNLYCARTNPYCRFIKQKVILYSASGVMGAAVMGAKGVMGKCFDKVMVPLLHFFTPFEIKFSHKMWPLFIHICGIFMFFILSC